MNALFRFIALSVLIVAAPVLAHDPLAIKPLGERTVDSLPDGALRWRIENFPDLQSAQAAAGRWSLAVETAGKVWLFTLEGEASSPVKGTEVAQVGPIPRPNAARYLLRINQATGTPGSQTPVHTHPGSEAFYVLRGEQSIRGPSDTLRVRAGQSEAGRGADVPMQVSSSGDTELVALVMFVVDATRPFSSPATMP